MVSDADLGAIIGGSVAGALVLIGIIAAIFCLCCGKSRRKDRDQTKKLQHTPHTTPSHSQPSSLGHNPPGGVVGVGSTGSGNRHSYPPTPGDPRLPKVGSNGLWLGTPGIYASTPSPAYYYGRPGGKSPHHHHYQQHQQHGGSGVLMQPAVMQRASSESRIPQQRDRHGHSKYRPPERRAASLQRVPAGPGIYAAGGGGSQQRIYHSQQLASLTPLYEVVDPRDGSIYDVYQIGGGAGSKTKLLSDSTGRSGERPSKKVQRSHSDANHEPPSKRPHRHKPSQDGHGHRSSKTGKETAQVHQPRDKKESGGHTNEAFVVSNEKINQVVQEALATDSMKILAKNKTDDEKKVVSSDAESVTSTPASAQDPSLHYTYGGDIYAVPNKEENKRRSRSENPILARMQDMILEGTQQSAQAPETVTDLTQTHEPLVVTPAYGESGPPGEHGTALIQNPIYQEVEEVVSERRSSDLAPAAGQDATSQVAAAVRAAAGEVDSGAHSAGDIARASAADDAGLDDVAATSAVTSLRDAGAREQVKGDAAQVKGSLEPRWSVDTDAATDELSRAGKHISVTAQAFEFLDTYLSDEDGADPRQSPPSSPVMEGEELIY